MRQLLWLFLLQILTTSFLLTASPAQAKPIATVKYTLKRVENKSGTRSTLVIPYAFSTTSLGFTAGVGAVAKGYGQDQLLIGGTVFSSTDGALAGVAGLWDWRIPKTKRLFLTLFGSSGWYPRNRAYTARSYPEGTTRPGTNESTNEQYLEASGYDNWAEASLEYVLPLGTGRTEGLQHYRIERGLLVSAPSGGKVWNPMVSGVTSIILRQNNRYQSYDLETLGKIDGAIHPVTLGLYHNNTDFPINPSYGSSQFLAVSQNFTWGESKQQWTFWEFEASKYFSLGDSKSARQRIIALNFWTGDTPTWKETLGADGIVRISDAPPFLDGARLGGFYRMRGYPQNRFNDRSVIYGAAEYRHTLRWNPFSGVKWLRFLQSDWVQLAGFAEAGRVAGDYHMSELTRDLKTDVGIGIRGMFAGGVARADFAVSEEGLNIWAMFNHPF